MLSWNSLNCLSIWKKSQKKYFSVKKIEFGVLGGIKGISVFLEDYWENIHSHILISRAPHCTFIITPLAQNKKLRLLVENRIFSEKWKNDESSIKKFDFFCFSQVFCMMMNTCFFFIKIIFGDNSINDHIINSICRKKNLMHFFFLFVIEKANF